MPNKEPGYPNMPAEEGASPPPPNRPVFGAVPLLVLPNRPPGFIALLPNKLAPGVPNNDGFAPLLLKLLPKSPPVEVLASPSLLPKKFG